MFRQSRTHTDSQSRNLAISQSRNLAISQSRNLAISQSHFPNARYEKASSLDEAFVKMVPATGVELVTY